jgi:DNA repair protein RadD
VVIANIIQEVGGRFLILQPSKEILTQNIAKYRAIGGEASIYSAIVGEKIVSEVVFATIGSVIGKLEIFKEFQRIMIDECHLVNPAEGMYRLLLESVRNLCCIGLTATPYRLRQSGRASVLDFLDSTVPAFFGQVVHVTQQQVLRDAGFLSPIIYKKRHEINTSNIKIHRGEYEEKSILTEMNRVCISDLIIQEIDEAVRTRNSVLVFVQFVEVLEKITAKRPDLFYLTGETNSADRSDLLQRFGSGELKVLLNVGVLTTGFDYPALDTIIVAKAMRSLSLWYQIIGRGQRIAPEKKDCLVVDMCANIDVLGDVQEIIIKQSPAGRWLAHNRRICTNKMY